MGNEGLADHFAEQQSPRELGSSKCFQCATCKQTFSQKYSLKRHAKTHTGEKPYPCNRCHQSFRTRDKLYTHTKSKHPTVLLVFQCDECGETLSSHSLLRAHRSTHTGVHECEQCARVFTEKKRLTQHKKHQHSTQSCVTRDICSQQFSQGHLLQDHKMCRTSGEQSCSGLSDDISEVQTTEENEDSNASHQEKCHENHRTNIGSDSVVIQDKNKASSESGDQTECDFLTQHSKISSLPQWLEVGNSDKAEHCATDRHYGESFKNFLEHKLHTEKCVHKRESNSGEAFNCEICMTFDSSCSQTRNADRLHDELERYIASSKKASVSDLCTRDDYNCPACHMKFQDVSSLKVHLETNSCSELCGSVCLNGKHFYNLNSCCSGKEGCKKLHAFEEEESKTNKNPVIVTVKPGNSVTYHQEESCESTRDGTSETEMSNANAALCPINNSVKPLVCDICSDSFPTSKELKLHRESHVDKPFVCTVCNKGFAVRRYLHAHKRVHTGEKPYRCDVCGKAFSQMSVRNAHLRRHVGEKPFECEVCGKQFPVKHALEVHRRTHTGEKPYSCKICGKLFSQLSAKNSHQRSHSGQKPFCCEKCGKKFAEKRYLDAHKKTHEKL